MPSQGAAIHVAPFLESEGGKTSALRKAEKDKPRPGPPWGTRGSCEALWRQRWHAKVAVPRWGICPGFGLIHPQVAPAAGARLRNKTAGSCWCSWGAQSPAGSITLCRVPPSPAQAGGHTGSVPAVPPLASQHLPLPAPGGGGKCPAFPRRRAVPGLRAQPGTPTPALSLSGLPDQLSGAGSPPTSPVSDPLRCSLSLYPPGRTGVKQPAPLNPHLAGL